MATNVKLLRFLGEDMLAEVLHETSDSITVKNPVRIVVIPNKTDPKSPSVGFSPWCEWTDDTEVLLTKHTFIATMEPLTVFVNQYNAQFGGVILPESKLIY